VRHPPLHDIESRGAHMIEYGGMPNR
jgi:hypothetical protein